MGAGGLAPMKFCELESLTLNAKVISTESVSTEFPLYGDCSIRIFQQKNW